jgi:hypothetical protein
MSSNQEIRFTRHIERTSDNRRNDQQRSRDYASGYERSSSQEREQYREIVNDFKKIINAIENKVTIKKENVSVKPINRVLKETEDKIPNKGATEASRLIREVRDNLKGKEFVKLEKTLTDISVAAQSNKTLREALTKITESYPFLVDLSSDSEQGMASYTEQANLGQDITDKGEEGSWDALLGEEWERSKKFWDDGIRPIRDLRLQDEPITKTQDDHNKPEPNYQNIEQTPINDNKNIITYPLTNKSKLTNIPIDQQWKHLENFEKFSNLWKKIEDNAQKFRSYHFNEGAKIPNEYQELIKKLSTSYQEFKQFIKDYHENLNNLSKKARGETHTQLWNLQKYLDRLQIQINNNDVTSHLEQITKHIDSGNIKQEELKTDINELNRALFMNQREYNAETFQESETNAEKYTKLFPEIKTYMQKVSSAIHKERETYDDKHDNKSTISEISYKSKDLEFNI